METRNSTELKKILDTMEADKRDMAQQMKAMQDQIQELLNSQTHGEDSNSHGSVNKEGSSGWRSNDIKVDIPEYDGKLDPDEFVEWNFEHGQNRFEYLLMKCDIPEDDPQTLVRYLGGLEPRVANVVELHTYQTLAELTILAHKVDSQQRSKGLGHIASECPNKRLVTLTDFEIAGGYDFGVETSDDQVRTSDPDKEVVGPDIGKLLVVRRALSSTPVREEKLQREAIFHTRCTVAQKVCSVIIDGGSCTNVASQTMVSKLGLLNEPHPAPYVIHWLNQGKGINVTHRVLLSFSIGKWYADKIWCDVIPMDACHVLLGRPWQFDRRVIHDGYLNTYSFVHNNRKIILTPIDPTTNSTKSTFSLSNLLKSEQHEYHSAKEFILLGLDEEEDKPH
ncbi:gag-pol polyprotein [Tanacetum coccineum]